MTGRFNVTNLPWWAKRKLMPLDLTLMNASVRIVGDVPDRTSAGHHRGAIGTGFLVSVPSEIDSRYRYGYVITAHHVLDGQTPSRIQVQAADPRSVGREELLEPVDVTNWRQPIRNVDLAIASFSNVVDERGIPITSALALERHVLPEGQFPPLGGEIYYIGIFNPLDRPMARSGTLGALFQEGLKFDGPYDYEAHLADCRTFQGFSGSPCYVQFTFAKQDPVDQTKMDFVSNPALAQEMPLSATVDVALLCGLLTEHIETTNPDEEAVSKYGVVFILPSQYIWAALRHPVLVAERREADKMIESEKDDSEPRAKRASVKPETVPDESEYERFEDLTRKLVNTPKPEREDGS